MGRSFLPGREGACLFGCRLTVPFRNLQGVACLACRLPDLAVREPTGVACLLCRLLPPAFSLLSCPLSPQPPSPAGKGVTKSLFRRGLRPRHPCTKPLAALTEPSSAVPGGGVQSTLPCGTGYPCPGGEDHLKRRRRLRRIVPSPPVPPLLGCRHCSTENASCRFCGEP